MPEAGLLTEVRWEWDGTEVADEDVANGATQFTVLDPDTFSVGDLVWFGDTGPHKVIAVNEESGLLTIYPGITEDLEESDPVVPDVGGEPARIWIGEVMLQDADDPIEVVLTAADMLIMPEGIYEPPVAVIISDDYEQVLDLPGQYPKVDAGLIDPETIPDVIPDWGVTPKDEFDDTVSAIEDEIEDARQEAASGNSANAQAINAAVQDYIDRFLAERAAWSAADDLVYEAVDNAVDDITAELATKSKHTLSPNPPGATANNAGDVWEQHKAGDSSKIIGRWRGAGGTSWSPMDLDATYIPLLDIGSGTFGDLSGARLTANTVGVEKLLVADFNDYVVDPYFQQPLGTPGVWGSGGSGATWARVEQTNPIYFTPSGYSTMLRVTTGSPDQYISTRYIPVEEGDEYHVSAKVRKWGGLGTSGFISVGLTFHDAQALQIGSAYASQLVSGLGTYDDWKTLEFTSDLGVVPAGAVTARVLIHTRTANSGLTFDVSEVHCRRRSAGQLIVDGSILAKHIDVANLNATGEITVSQSQVSGLTQSLLDASESAVSELKTLWGGSANSTTILGGSIATRSIAVDKLLVSDFTNYVTDPYFERPLAPSASASNGGWFLATGPSSAWLKVSYTAAGYSTPSGRPNMLRLITPGSVTYVANPSFSVEPGEEYHVTGKLRRWGGTATGNVLVGIVWMDAAGAQVGSAYNSIPVTSLTVYYDWHSFEFPPTTGFVPANATQGRVIIHSNNTTAGMTIDFADITCRRRNAGELIVDGSIQARHITADMVTGILVTGRVLQTDAAPSRGIKISTAGLISYNNSTGEPTTTINPTTGRISAVGGFATATGYGDVSITPGNSALNPARMEFWPVRSGIDAVTGRNPSLSVYTQLEGSNRDAGMLRLQGPMATNATTRSRIDVHTSRQQGSGNQPVRADIWYHAGGQYGGFGTHRFIIDDVQKAWIDSNGVSADFFGTGAGGRIGVNVLQGAVPNNGIYALGNIKSGGRIDADTGFVDQSVAIGANAGWQGSSVTWNTVGRLVGSVSSRRFKEDIEPLPLDVALRTLDLEPVTFKYRAEQDMGDTVFPGVIAEQAEEVGLGLWVTRDSEGDPAGFRYAELTAAHNVLIKDLYDRIDALEASRA